MAARFARTEQVGRASSAQPRVRGVGVHVLAPVPAALALGVRAGRCLDALLAGRAQCQHQRAQQHKRRGGAQGVGQAGGAVFGRAGARAHQAEQFDRQHREHAGHEVVIDYFAELNYNVPSAVIIGCNTCERSIQTWEFIPEYEDSNG